MLIEYRFLRASGEEEFTLVQMTVSDGSERDGVPEDPAALLRLRKTFGLDLVDFVVGLIDFIEQRAVDSTPV